MFDILITYYIDILNYIEFYSLFPICDSTITKITKKIRASSQ